MSKQKQVKRSLRINLKDGSYTDLNITKAAAVKLDSGFINFDKLPDGSWRLLYDPSVIEDFSQVVNFEMIRED